MSRSRAAVAFLGALVLAGAVHGFFGRYGPQRLDGTPTATRAEAEAAIIARLTRFVPVE